MSLVPKLEPNPVTPDVYGNTPFQHEVTSEPMNASVVVVRPIKAIGFWQRTMVRIQRNPGLPDWMQVNRPDR